MQLLAEGFFYFFFFLIFYAYFGYPLVLLILGIFKKKDLTKSNILPSVSIICPVYNESLVLREKIINTLNLDYPKNLVQIIIVSDASDDETDNIIEQFKDQGVLGYRLVKRSGKAAALNLGLSNATNDIVVFTDASILIASDALRKIVAPFADVSIGCVSGEDHIDGSAGESLYGRYELALRNLESKIDSIVGASGCFYAQRRHLIKSFPSGRAPDFYSVLKTVEAGFRAVTEPSAQGVMKHVPSMKNEFQRKTRTLLRGITTLFSFPHLFDPRKFLVFSFFLWSHKIARWLCGFAQLGMLVSNIFLFSTFWAVILMLQVIFYGLALSGYLRFKTSSISFLERIPLFFCVANFAAIHAFIMYFLGVRIEIWSPSKRI